MSGYSPEFDWNPSNDVDHSIVVRHQPAIAVYLNPHDEVVIRQQDDYDHDQFVYITKDNVLKVVERVLAIAGIQAAQAQAELLMLPRPERLSGAERQRRYRNKHRNGNGDEERHGGDALLLLQVNGAEDQQELAG
jgi:hypothetical protein